MSEPSGERIQKVLAQAGLGSRREIERWIAQGRVSVNGETVTLGARLIPSDAVRVDGKPVKLNVETAADQRVIVYSKPEGVICSRSDPEGRPTVFQNLPRLRNQRWISVGRLDINTSGLLILTTDGELANRLMHPSYGVDREYAVRIHGQVDDEMIARLKEGVLLEDGIARFTDIQSAGGDSTNQWFHVALMEGRNREVRRLWESQGVQVSRLKRVRYGCIFLPSRLKVGAWEELNNKEINDLRSLVNLPSIRVKAKDPKVRQDDQRRQRRAFNSKSPRRC
ncbi:23S rRNA pseudouridylate synthase B [Oleiphilus sp. HI0125]|uniref:23S rRNA pseudouridine(2605) synthase RluB n=1 Tax=Oleiphilus sp. HI0125 TaxID=1822266 RepID=UPI0007C2D421|nr:23S rRNA pseudouridine(2605) synthase RluB [Oleiphilus sp. HI0125]KZZ60699.1 23S rRNA pseudouridylate synthase B [Oleiphilus sp. HI0125]KZZ63087.1 23S rRNA pseudouridylate synthase B [Oleiphilus sp. HI0125]